MRLVEDQVAILVSDWRANNGMVRRLNGGRNAPRLIGDRHKATGPRAGKFNLKLEGELGTTNMPGRGPASSS